jgi:hypothetical protein
MSPTFTAIAGIGAIGVVAYAAVSARTKRSNPHARRISSGAKTETAPTVRDELRRIARENDVPDVMPKGVRTANAINTADQLDDARFESDTYGDGGGTVGGDE